MNVTGERLRQLRESKELSQKEVANLIGVARPTYVLYETGKSRPIRKIKELCALFNVTSDYILGNDNATSKLTKNETDIYDMSKITKHERKLLEKYRELSEAAKIRVEARIDAEYDMMKEVEQEKSKDA